MESPEEKNKKLDEFFKFMEIQRQKLIDSYETSKINNLLIENDIDIIE